MLKLFPNKYAECKIADKHGLLQRNHTKGLHAFLLKPSPVNVFCIISFGYFSKITFLWILLLLYNSEVVKSNLHIHLIQHMLLSLDFVYFKKKQAHKLMVCNDLRPPQR